MFCLPSVLGRLATLWLLNPQGDSVFCMVGFALFQKFTFTVDFNFNTGQDLSFLDRAPPSGLLLSVANAR